MLVSEGAKNEAFGSKQEYVIEELCDLGTAILRVIFIELFPIIVKVKFPKS